LVISGVCSYHKICPRTRGDRRGEFILAGRDWELSRFFLLKAKIKNDVKLSCPHSCMVWLGIIWYDGIIAVSHPSE